MNRYLLDTCTLIEWAIDPSRLSTEARAAIGDGRSFIFVSAASTWEIAIKQKLGKLPIVANIDDLLLANRFEPLSITVEHSLATLELPMHHKDPFDRMLIAQARLENLKLITKDRIIVQYPVTTLAA